jgi:PAS domain S-box-containing protein
MDHTPQLDRPRRRAALDHAMHEQLAPVLVVLVLLYVGYAVGHAVGREPDELRRPLVLSTTISAVALLLLDRLRRRGHVPVARAVWLAAAVIALVLWNCRLYLVLSGDPSTSTDLMFAFVGAALVFLSWRLLAFTLVGGWIAFLSVASFAGPDGSEWQHVAMALATATAVAVAVHAARVRTVLRFEGLRRVDAERVAALRGALESLAESEQRHRHLVENDLGIILTHDLEGRILSVNPAAAAALGRERDTLIGTDLTSLVAEESPHELAPYLERVRRSDRQTGVLRILAADGGERLWEYVCVRLEERQRPPYLLLHAHDVTERVQLEHRLRAARGELQSRVRARTRELEAANAALREEIDERRRIDARLLRYGRAVEACSDGIILAELDGTIVDANRTLLELCGAASKAQLVGRKLGELVAPEDHERVARGLAEVRAGDAGPPHEFVLLQVTGERIPVEAALAVVRDQDDRPCALIAVGRDITWRKQMENSLRHNEAFLRALIDHSTDTILVLDSDGTVLARPNGAEQPIGRFGYAADQLLGRFGRDFIHAEDTPAVGVAFLQATASPGGRASVECRLRDGSGCYRPGEIVFCNLLDEPSVGGVMCSVRDLSDRKRAEAELREARDAAEAASQAKGEFLNTMSHELRTPIHAVLGYAEMLEDDAFGTLSTEQREIVQRITDRARDQFELIAAVLDLSAMDAGRMTVQAAPVVLEELFAALEGEGRSAWRASGLALAWDVPADLPPLISDSAKIKIVVRNLVGNAVKFTAHGGVSVSARPLGDGIEIAVADTGIGIPAEQCDAIFAPFFQIDGSETRRYEGSGLGLHIVKRLLDLLGGTVRVESEVGRGTTFRVWLPLLPATPCADAPMPSAVPPSDRSRPLAAAVGERAI